MANRRTLIEKLLRVEPNFYFMYSENGLMFFRNNRQITEEEYKAAEKPSEYIDMPLFFNEDVKKWYNLRTFKTPENNTKNTRNERERREIH